MKKAFLILFLMTTKLTFGQTNSGFELWDSVYTNTYSADLSNIYGVPNPLGGIVNSWTASSGYGVSRTTDSYSGNYSLILHNWYNYAYEWISYHDAISYTPQYLQGYYKYITGGNNGLSQGRATVTLTRFNGTSNDTISTGTYLFDSTIVFVPFQLNIGLTSQIADSVSISIINATNPCNQDVVCNLLYLDNLTLTTTPLGIENSISNENAVSVFPNPFSTETILQRDKIFKDATLTIYNSFGQVVKETKNINGQTIVLHRDNLASGLYFIRLTEDNKTFYADKLVITD